MCDRIGILDKGKLVALDTTKNLINKIQTKIVSFKLNKNIIINNESINNLQIISNSNNLLTVSYEKSKLLIDDIINYIKDQKIDILDISTDDGDLEDVFLKLTKH